MLNLVNCVNPVQLLPFSHGGYDDRRSEIHQELKNLDRMNKIYRMTVVMSLRFADVMVRIRLAAKASLIYWIYEVTRTDTKSRV